MFLQFKVPTHLRVAAVAIGAFVALTPVGARAQQGEGPFAGLGGTWSGAGTISMANGASERIRCRTTYSVGGGGTTLQQSLRCASDSYKLEISSSLVAAGDAVSGTWSEATRNARGQLRGSANGGEIRASIVGVGFTAGLGVNTRGRTQSVTISPRGATDIRNVTISLHKG